MRKSNNLYTTTINGLLNPGGSLTGSFDISRNLQRFFLKSVGFDYSLIDNTTGEVLNPINNSWVLITFILGFGAITFPASPFSNIVNPAGFTNVNDGSISLTNPGQMFFENFLSNTNMPVAYALLNNDAIVAYNCIINFFAEVEPY